MVNKSTPPRSAYGPTHGGGKNAERNTGGFAGNAASDLGHAAAAAKQQQSPKRVPSAKPGNPLPGVRGGRK